MEEGDDDETLEYDVDQMSKESQDNADNIDMDHSKSSREENED